MKRKNQTKELIIEKTKELIVTNSTLTIKDISDACFVNVAAINYYFGSKDNLFNIVINEIVDKLKVDVLREVNKITQNTDIKETLAIITNIIYNFAVNNMGIIRFLFLNNDAQQGPSNSLLESFFGDNDFTKIILSRIMESYNITDISAAYTKYIVLFSSFSIPIFIGIAKSDSNPFLSTISNKDFQENYISELLKILT